MQKEKAWIEGQTYMYFINPNSHPWKGNEILHTVPNPPSIGGNQNYIVSPNIAPSTTWAKSGLPAVHRPPSTAWQLQPQLLSAITLTMTCIDSICDCMQGYARHSLQDGGIQCQHPTTENKREACTGDHKTYKTLAIMWSCPVLTSLAFRQCPKL